MIKAYRTVSLNSALVLAGVLPLDIRIRENASLYEVRRGLRPPIPDREVETPLPYTERPHPAQHIGQGFLLISNPQEIEIMVNSAVHMYTDGSKIDGKVGAAISIWKGATEIKKIKINLPTYCTVYQAELLAICEAARVAVKELHEPCAVLSDSRAALQTIANNNSTHRLAVKTRLYMKKAQEHHRAIELLWIKAHNGIAGNERADQLAKNAALRSKRRPIYDRCPVSYAKRLIRQNSLQEWNKRYQTCTTGTVTKLFLPDAIEAYKTVRKLKVSPTRTQILTGHGGCAAYLSRFKCRDSPSCACDPAVEETVFHLLFDCPIHSKRRWNTENILGAKISPLTVHKIIKDDENRETFLEYCTIITQKAITKNKT